jgi:hypothetical protein
MGVDAELLIAQPLRRGDPAEGFPRRRERLAGRCARLAVRGRGPADEDGADAAEQDQGEGRDRSVIINVDSPFLRSRLLVNPFLSGILETIPPALVYILFLS